MLTPEQIEWCREHLPAFKACHDQAEAARKSSEENRKRMATYMRAKDEVRCE